MLMIDTPGRAHHRVLGVDHELRHGEQRADQRGDRQQLVQMPRQAERYEGHRRRQAIALHADILELVDEIEESEQHQQRGQHQHDAARHLAHQVTPQHSHRRRHRLSRKPEHAPVKQQCEQQRP